MRIPIKFRVLGKWWRMFNMDNERIYLVIKEVQNETNKS